ncbi:hypothetical protein R6Q59_031080 [Mikania micrantha]
MDTKGLKSHGELEENDQGFGVYLTDLGDATARASTHEVKEEGCEREGGHSGGGDRWRTAAGKRAQRRWRLVEDGGGKEGAGGNRSGRRERGREEV